MAQVLFRALQSRRAGHPTVVSNILSKLVQAGRAVMFDAITLIFGMANPMEVKGHCLSKKGNLEKSARTIEPSVLLATQQRNVGDNPQQTPASGRRANC